MLPLWRDQVRIGLAPQAIALARLGRGWRPRLQDSISLRCNTVPGSGWQAALKTLQQVLAEAKWQQADAQVILSSHFVRYLLLPGNAEIRGRQEQEAYAKHRYSKVFGAAANAWTLRYTSAAAGMPTLASAIEQGFLDGIRQTCLAGKLHLRSVQPHLMSAFNACYQIIGKSPAWFALLESDRLVLARYEGDAWHHISTHALNADDPMPQLAQLLERQLQLAGTDEAPAKIWLAAPGLAGLPLPQSPLWHLQAVPAKNDWQLAAPEQAACALLLGAA